MLNFIETQSKCISYCSESSLSDTDNDSLGNWETHRLTCRFLYCWHVMLQDVFTHSCWALEKGDNEVLYLRFMLARCWQLLWNHHLWISTELKMKKMLWCSCFYRLYYFLNSCADKLPDILFSWNNWWVMFVQTLIIGIMCDWDRTHQIPELEGY